MEASPRSLHELAEEEANLAEAEAANRPELVKDEPLDPFAHPGEQGVATQDEEPAGVYEAPEPTQQELGLAADVFRKLVDGAHEMGPQAVIDALIAIVDVHPQLRTPVIFQSDDDEEVYALADTVAEAARILLRSGGKLEALPNDVVFYWKNHEKWTSGGHKVHGQVKRFDGFFQHHLEGQKAAVIINYHLWVVKNPRQKVFTLYHLLRELDSECKGRAPDWVGYFEEPGLFGAGVQEEMVQMAKAFVKDAATHSGDPHQLSMLAGIYED